jgi:hypothetical protein
MNPAFDEVLAAGADTMLSAFDTTALRLGTSSQNIEKDFWVCWTLDGASILPPCCRLRRVGYCSMPAGER